VLRRSGLLVALATLLAGCSIDRIEWESTGFPVEEVTHALKEEHHLAHPVVECIKREVGGAVWECRARARDGEFECKVHVGPREKIHAIHCHEKHESEAPDEQAPDEGAEH
jgi:hypothetical protein